MKAEYKGVKLDGTPEEIKKFFSNKIAVKRKYTKKVANVILQELCLPKRKFKNKRMAEIQKLARKIKKKHPNYSISKVMKKACKQFKKK